MVSPPGNGGTVILGRVAVAPVLLLNGTMLSSQADEEAVFEAHSNLLDAVWTSCTVGRQATGVRNVLKRLAEDRLAGDLVALRDPVSDQWRLPHLRPPGEDAGRPGRIAFIRSRSRGRCDTLDPAVPVAPESRRAAPAKRRGEAIAMPDHVSAPTRDPSAPSGDAPGTVPTAMPPFTGSGPHPRPTVDALDTPETPLVVQDEPGESAGAAPEGDEALADRAAEEVFGSEDNARNTAGLITNFVASWERHKHEKSPAVWLADEFRRYPDLWTGEEEIVSTANEVVANVERANADKASLHAHLDAGRSKASWLAGNIEQGAAAAGAANVGDYAARIDEALKTANDQMLGTVSTRIGAVNRIPNLDGFIAEQHHADTFNLDAAAKGSPLRAEVLGSQGKNSVDVVIKDGHGHTVRRYQAKYGQDAEATRHLFEKGDYRGQRKLVPSGQEGDLPRSTDRLEADGVHSKPLTKDEAKRLQEKAQQEQESPQYEWNDVNRIEVAKSIGKQALVGAALACGFQGARILGRRVGNFLRGKENPPASEDLREFFESSVKSAGHVGAQTAVSGAVVVAVKNGWIPILKNTTPAGRIVGIVHVAMENARVLFKLAKGELNGEEALDAMGNCTASAVGGLVGAGKGAVVGAALGGPVGAVVGGVVGGMAGSKIGEAVYEGGKAIVKTAGKVRKALTEGLAETVKSVGRVLDPLSWSS